MDLQKLRARLKAAGLTQQDVAGRLGRAHSQVSRMLSGKARLHVDTLAKIEVLIEEAERASRMPGVAETTGAYHPMIIRSVTLEEARKPSGRSRMLDEEREAWLREIRELGEAGKRLPRVTDMSDEQILGYEETE